MFPHTLVKKSQNASKENLLFIEVLSVLDASRIGSEANSVERLAAQLLDLNRVFRRGWGHRWLKLTGS